MQVRPGSTGDTMKITDSIWKTTDELYANFDRGLIDFIRKTPEFIADVNEAIPEARKIYYSPDWEKIGDMDIGSRVLCVYIGIKNGNGSQNDMCQLAEMSPKTYRKYRDKWSSRLEIEYNKYEKEMREAIRNFMLWNVLAFSTDGIKEIKRHGITNEEAFLKHMKEKDIPYIVECVQECFDSLTPEEKEVVMSI
jgi:hypothetical protein